MVNGLYCLFVEVGHFLILLIYIMELLIVCVCVISLVLYMWNEMLLLLTCFSTILVILFE